MMLEIYVLAEGGRGEKRDSHKNVVVLNRWMGSQPSPHIPTTTSSQPFPHVLTTRIADHNKINDPVT
jgi:hypothetical protein